MQLNRGQAALAALMMASERQRCLVPPDQIRNIHRAAILNATAGAVGQVLMRRETLRTKQRK